MSKENQINDNQIAPGFTPKNKIPVGGIIFADQPIEYNTDRPTLTVTVRNTGDRPIQVGSHFHFFEVNRYLEFDRVASLGYHLNIPASSAIRFEPGEEKEVSLITFGGKRRIIGFNNLVDGYTGDEGAPTFFPATIRAIKKLEEYGYKTISEKDAQAEYKTNVNKK
ncbi:urease subunit beta [Apibacter muscae]|uniref:urease subunit beta n=1 Tax=Apibacter muscae TaxID=2509004 RepID=UPI0011AD9E30|nr:urease subunit beta [Apibacter muscae]TWP25232.1 urease subunit beta [Apibacter muscae]